MSTFTQLFWSGCRKTPYDKNTRKVTLRVLDERNVNPRRHVGLARTDNRCRATVSDPKGSFAVLNAMKTIKTV